MGPLFFFGAMSPYSWFAAERIGELLPDALWRPVYAGALFRDSGRSSWGLGERREERIAECEARALSYGLGEIRWPDPWPTNDVTVARAMTFADRGGMLREFALAAMRMAFLEGVDLGRVEAVEGAAEHVGMDAREVREAISRQEIKDALKETNQRARSLGVFGVPTVALGDRLFWGDDRLDEAAAVQLDQRSEA